MSFSYHLVGNPEGLEPELSLLWDLGCNGIEERPGKEGDPDEVIAYFSERLEIPLNGTWQEQDDVDWVNEYFEGLEPIYLEKLIIAPTHVELDEPAKAGKQVIWLNPGMAFGTGHHETTYLALADIEQRDFAGKSVLDVGAGSGILAIAAEMFGAETIEGLDNDPITIEIAEENAKANNTPKCRFYCKLLDDSYPSEAYDMVLANIYAEVHVDLATQYNRILKDGGELVTTGIMAEKLDMVLEALGKYFEITSVTEKGNWRLVAGVKKSV